MMLASISAYAKTITGRVVGVSDGDTITLLDASNIQTKIRLAGIDAPEKKQPFGQRSKANLSSLIYNKNVTIEWQKTDRYGRTLGKIIVGDQDANLAQVRNGFAWHYKAYEREQSSTDRTTYASAEIDARSKHLGLWQDANPIPPWDYRHGTGQASTETRPQSSEACLCSTSVTCTGAKGGIYCTTPSGTKKYHKF